MAKNTEPVVEADIVLPKPAKEVEELPQAPEPQEEPESSTGLTTSNQDLLDEYRRRAEEAEQREKDHQRRAELAEAGLADVQASLRQLTGKKGGPMPWEDKQGRHVYYHRAHSWGVWNPVKGHALEFTRLPQGGSEFRTKDPKEIAFFNALSHPDSEQRKSGLTRMTPWPQDYVPTPWELGKEEVA